MPCVRLTRGGAQGYDGAMRTLPILLALALLFTACGGAGAPAGEDGATSGAEDEPTPTDEGRPVVEGPDGVPEDCPFRVADLCYSTSEAACRAAGCEPDACAILESYPAQIRCE